MTGNRIATVGSERDVASWATPKTRVVDARGKLLLPGFNDSHVHFLDGGAHHDEGNAGFCEPVGGHMSLANTAALKLAGVTRDTKSPDGGLIVKDPVTGEPTGVLKDAAMSLVYCVIPAMSMEKKLAVARAATHHAASLGLTSVQEMSTGTDVAKYQELARRGELKTRLCSEAGCCAGRTERLRRRQPRIDDGAIL